VIGDGLQICVALVFLLAEDLGEGSLAIERRIVLEKGERTFVDRSEIGNVAHDGAGPDVARSVERSFWVAVRFRTIDVSR